MLEHGVQYDTQYKNTIVPLMMAFVISFISLSMKNAHPHFTFSVICPFVLWPCYHSLHFPFNNHINKTMAPILFMFLAHQFYLHYILSPNDLEEVRRRYGQSRRNNLADTDNLYGTGNEQQHDDKCGRSPRNWKFAYYMLWNARLIGTPWEAPRVRLRSFIKDKDTGKPIYQSKSSLSRRRFLWRRSFILLGRYLALCCFWDSAFHHYMPDGKVWTSSDFTTPNRFLFPMLLNKNPFVSRGIIIRLHLLIEVIMFNCVETSAQHDVLAIVAVATRLDTPDDWPFLYGSITDAYSVRRYWGRFWHLLVYRSFSALAELFSRNILRLPTTHPMTRYLRNTLVFVISGLMHFAVQRFVTPEDCHRCGCAWTMWYYIYQITGVFIEEIFWGLLLPSWVAKGQSRGVRFLRRLFGFLWVLCWSVFILELNEFPYISCSLNITI